MVKEEGAFLLGFRAAVSHRLGRSIRTVCRKVQLIVYIFLKKSVRVSGKNPLNIIFNAVLHSFGRSIKAVCTERYKYKIYYVQKIRKVSGKNLAQV